METTRVFQNGHSQAVRLPKAFRFDCEVVYITRENGAIVLRAIPSTPEGLVPALAALGLARRICVVDDPAPFDPNPFDTP